MEEHLFPSFEIKTKILNGKTAVFDIIRKKYLILTPEELVRQQVIHFLINHKKYPRALIKVEDGMKFNRMMKRSDIVVYRKTGEVFMVVECKASKVKLTQKSMDQLSIYNQNYKAEYLALTNGVSLHVCKIDYDTKQISYLSEFPLYK